MSVPFLAVLLLLLLPFSDLCTLLFHVYSVLTQVLLEHHDPITLALSLYSDSSSPLLLPADLAERQNEKMRLPDASMGEVALIYHHTENSHDVPSFFEQNEAGRFHFNSSHAFLYFFLSASRCLLCRCAVRLRTRIVSLHLLVHQLTFLGCCRGYPKSPRYRYIGMHGLRQIHVNLCQISAAEHARNEECLMRWDTINFARRHVTFVGAQ